MLVVVVVFFLFALLFMLFMFVSAVLHFVSPSTEKK